jgi:hypothetical protein
MGKDMINLERFKRANFFTGLLASSEFWNEMQDYHLRKERFYNLVFHGPGIVPGVMDELKVSSVKKGGNLTIIVGPGFAIDMRGRGLFFYEPHAKIIDLKKYRLPSTVYISIHYNEVQDEFYQSKENPEHQGYQKRLETAVIELTSEKPDNVQNIEIARIYLEEDENGEIKSIDEPENITNPKANEIDTRFVNWSRAAKAGLSPYLKKYLVDILDKTKLIASHANDSMNFRGLRELQTVVLTGKMLVECGSLDFKEIIHIINPIHDLNNHIIQEMIDYERVEEKRTFSSKESFTTLRTKIHEMGDLIKYYDQKLETIDKIVKCQEEVLTAMRNIIITKKTTWEDISLISYELPNVLIIDDARYTLVEFLDFNDTETDKRCELTATGNKDFSSAKQGLLYPDDIEVRDTIKRYVSGEVSFTVRNLIKRRELVMIRRTDIFHGNYRVDVLANDESMGQLVVDGFDTKNRWRNLHMVFEEDIVRDNILKFSFRIGESGRDNFGKIWFYQKL